jgi:hypothetical protein
MTAARARGDITFSSNNEVRQSASSFICAHSECGAFALHYWGSIVQVETASSKRPFSDNFFVSARCSACNRETVWSGNEMLWPVHVIAPPPADDMPHELLADFEEARRIHQPSPRGAAALLRLVVQKLCPILGSDKPDINGAIGDLVAQQKISPALQQALDSVRVIGNEAVHPGELDIKDDHDTVESLFKLINFIVYEAITRPKEIAAIYNSLPANKLAGIVTRDKPKAS